MAQMGGAWAGRQDSADGGDRPGRTLGERLATGPEPVYIPRLADQRLRDLLAAVPAVELRGPRGCGKTTTALRQARSAFYLDDPEEAELLRVDARAVFEGSEPPILIDEWQQAPDVLWTVKRIVDRAPAENGLFIITGSLRSTQASQLPSTGRVMPLDMFPLTVAEKTQSAAASLFDRIASGDLGSAAPGLDANDYMDMALASGYPRAMTMPSEALRASALRARVDQTLNVDSLLGRQDRAKLLEFARVYASHTAKVMPLASLCEETGISRTTGRAYLALLERTYLAHEAPAFVPGGVSRVQKSPKRLLVDAGLAAAMWGRDAWAIRRSGDLRGRLMETFVAAQLRAEHDPRVSGQGLCHFRRDGAQEVDFILDGGPRGIVGLEVKAGERAGLHEARHLLWLRDRLGGRFAGGVVLHTAPRRPVVLSPAVGGGLGGGRVWAAPLSTLWQ